MLKQVSFNFVTGVAYDVKISAVGNTIQTFINGTLIDTTTDTLFTQGPIGFRTGNSESFNVDDVTVTQTVPDPPSAPGAAGTVSGESELVGRNSLGQLAMDGGDRFARWIYSGADEIPEHLPMQRW